MSEWLVENVDETKTSEYADFIRENFLNSFLNEETNSVFENINKLKFQETIDFKDIADSIIDLKESNVSDITKLQIMAELTQLFGEWVDAEAEVASYSLNEYAGNPEKNKILLETMVEMEKQFNEYYKECDFVITSLDEIFKIVTTAAKAKNPNAKEAALKVKSIYKKVNSALTSEDYKNYNKVYNATFRKLRDYCKKFSIKFNDVVMEDKKEFDKKLSAAAKKVSENDKFTSWLPSHDTGRTEKIKELNEALDILGVDNGDSVKSIVSDLQPIYNYGYTCLIYYIGNINYIRHALRLEKENTIFYKVLNKVIKTKK